MIFFTDTDRRYVVMLVWQKDKFSPLRFTLTILVDPYIQVNTGILVHPILVDTEERVIVIYEADTKVFGCAC